MQCSMQHCISLLFQLHAVDHCRILGMAMQRFRTVSIFKRIRLLVTKQSLSLNIFRVRARLSSWSSLEGVSFPTVDPPIAFRTLIISNMLVIMALNLHLPSQLLYHHKLSCTALVPCTPEIYLLELFGDLETFSMPRYKHLRLFETCLARTK